MPNAGASSSPTPGFATPKPDDIIALQTDDSNQSGLLDARGCTQQTEGTGPMGLGTTRRDTCTPLLAIISQVGRRMAPRWRLALWYGALILAANLLWEVAHLPLYTLWRTASRSEQAFAVLHCTGGDALIALLSLGLAVLVHRSWRWPEERFGRVLLAATLIGVAYTVFSEWWNVEWRGAWAYASAMPRLPWVGTGVTPLLQWVLLPPLCLWGARRLSERDSALGAK